MRYSFIEDILFQREVLDLISLNLRCVSLTFSPGMRIGSSLAVRVSSQSLLNISYFVVLRERYQLTVDHNPREFTHRQRALEPELRQPEL